MFLGNRMKNKSFLGNRFSGAIDTIGTYITPENIDKAAQLAIATHKAYSDIERYRNKTHD